MNLSFREAEAKLVVTFLEGQQSYEVLGNPLFYSKIKFWCIFILSRKVST